VERGELVAHFQPTICLADGRIAGAETLVRWQHPERGLLYPAEFIGIAEDSGLIVPVGDWVLEEACRRTAAWATAREPGAPMVVSVNLSGRQLAKPDLAAAVAATVERTGVDPACVQLEITESVLMEEPHQVRATLDQLRATGVSLAVDDFGTGYSSLAYLKRFPAQALKIDRSFVAGLGVDAEDTIITTAVIRLAHTLGLAAVAEGVETPDQLAILRELGCDLAQGYLFSAGIPADAFTDLLRRDPRW
jgi:EAL domain-containing protein (putative c-di-GMP-specific phosphodiesterase class I)